MADDTSPTIPRPAALLSTEARPRSGSGSSPVQIRSLPGSPTFRRKSANAVEATLSSLQSGGAVALGAIVDVELRRPVSAVDPRGGAPRWPSAASGTAPVSASAATPRPAAAARSNAAEGAAAEGADRGSRVAASRAKVPEGPRRTTPGSGRTTAASRAALSLPAPPPPPNSTSPPPPPSSNSTSPPPTSILSADSKNPPPYSGRTRRVASTNGAPTA